MALTKVQNQTIASGTLQANSIADGVVSANHIASKGLTANTIADGNITSAKIAASTIQANNIATGAITIDKVPLSANVAFQHRDNNFTGNIDVGGVLTVKAPTAVTNTDIGTNSQGNRTLSLSTPSGGANGDVWYVYE